MSASPEISPQTVNFPPPVRAPEKKIQFPIPVKRPNERIKFPTKPSVEKTLRQATPTRVVEDPQPLTGIEEYRSTLEREEEELREKQRDFARLKAETLERIRAAKELEILLDAREQLLDEREESFKEVRDQLDQANRQLRESEETIARMRDEMDQLKQGQLQACAAVADTTGSSSESLAEQAALLKEREAYIEKSENVLFDKAQHLQEWETRLQQREHDLNNAAS